MTSPDPPPPEAGAARDERLAVAIGHWSARLLANGVDPSDFERVTAGVQRWADWGPAWCAAAERHEAQAREAEARGARLSRAEALARAALYYHFARFIVFDDPALYAHASQKVAALYAAAAPDLNPPAERVAVPYRGFTLAGYLRRPTRVAAGARPPLALLIAGLDSTKEEVAAYEALFLRRGVATLAFDGPGQGEAERALPIEPAFERVAGAVLDWLASRPDVDAARVAAVGVSLGGYYAARAVAFEPRLAAGVSMGGPYDFGVLFDRLPPMTRQALRVRSHAADEDEARRRAAALTLEGVARHIRVPFLVVFGKRDPLIPYQQAERLVAEIPERAGHLVLYEDGNHVCNNLAPYYRPLVADWVAARLGVTDA